MSTKASVLITGARASVAFDLARLLIDAGHAVTMVDNVKHPVATASRLGIRYRCIPPFSPEADAAGVALARIVSEEGIDVVIPTCEEVLHLGALWGRTAPDAALFAPDLTLLCQVHDKYRFVGLCDELGQATSQTRLLTSQDEVAAHAPDAQDLVFKPVLSRFGSPVVIRPHASQLRGTLPTPDAPWVVREFVPGTELCVYAIARDGRITALSVYRGLVRAGPSAPSNHGIKHLGGQTRYRNGQPKDIDRAAARIIGAKDDNIASRL